MADVKVWTAREKGELKRLQGLRDLFEGNHTAYFVLPNGEERRYEYVTINWLGDTLSQTWKRLLFRQFPTLAGRDEQETATIQAISEMLGLPEICQPAALQVSWAGRATFKLYYSQVSGRPALRLWGANPTEFVVCDYLGADHSQPLAANCWYQRQVRLGNNDEATVAIRERHELLFDQMGEAKAVLVSNKAWRMEGGEPDREVPWAEVWPDPATAPLEEEQIEGLTELPIVIVENVDRNGDGSGDTDYTNSVISVQKNVNKLAAERQLVIDLSEQPQLVIPAEYMDEQGRVDWNRVRMRIKYPGEEADDVEIKAINWSGNLENSAAQWEFYRKEFQTLTGIAPPFMGESAKGGGDESGYARRLGMVPTEAEVGFRRRPWEVAFTKIVRVAMMLERAYAQPQRSGVRRLFERLLGRAGQMPEPVEAVTVTWPPAIPEDSTEISTRTVAEYAGGVRSLESAIELLNPSWQSARRAQELELIREDAATRASLNPFTQTGEEGEE